MEHTVNKITYKIEVDQHIKCFN